jgi:hypothetical protein
LRKQGEIDAFAIPVAPNGYGRPGQTVIVEVFIKFNPKVMIDKGCFIGRSGILNNRMPEPDV